MLNLVFVSKQFFWMLLPIVPAITTILVRNLIFGGESVVHVMGRTSSLLSFDQIPLLIGQVIYILTELQIEMDGRKHMKLLFQAFAKLLSGMVAISLLLFLPAGTYLYPNGWLFCALLFVPMLIVCAILFSKDKELLAKRLNSKEKEGTQKLVILVSAFEFIGCFISAGFDFRYGWTHVPTTVVILASVLFFCAYLLYAEVMRENAYLSRTVEIQENQQIVSTGLYGIVRHPMYAATLLLFTMMPIVLGSWIALACMVPFPFILAKRIQNEETVLRAGLDGYEEYMKKVKYRLIPFVW